MGRRFYRHGGDKSEEIEVAVSIEPPASAAAAAEFLRESDVILCESIAWGSNYNFAVLLQRGEEQRLAVYKPERGEAPLWDFPDGTLYRRERAAYLLATDLGWRFIPPTVVRDGPRGNFFTLRDSYAGEMRRMALFDAIANNAGRKGGHCLRSASGEIWGIDHGLTFHAGYKLRTVIWDYSDEPIADGLLADMRALAQRLEDAN